MVGNYYFKACQDYKGILKYYIKAESVQRRIEKTSSSEQAEYADLIDGIGITLHHLDRKAEALEYHKRAMEIRERVLGKKHLDYATSLNNMGGILSDLGKYEEAMLYYKAALKIAKNNPNESVLYLHNIGCIYAEQDKYKEALKHFRKAQAIERNNMGEEKNLHILYNLSGLYYLQSKYKEALKNIGEAMLIEEKRIIKQYPEYITLLNNISYVIAHDKYEEALKYYKDIKAQEKESIYATYPHHYNNLYRMSSILYQLGNTKEALLYINQALSIVVRIFGKKHQEYIGCLKVEGDILCALGEYKKALECYVERAKILKECMVKRMVVMQVH
ncbi:tetratricopeptide repeat protein [Holosporaceae bacterium 'Namur']|nr:tetratricopeptide repeat protein [Holosporaceae bacterium 'Namur']